MPAMTDLLTQLQEDPPTTEMELRAILDGTGYDLVMKEPMMEEAPEDMGPVEEEEVVEEEDGVDEEAAVVEMEDPTALMERLMPPGMGAPHPNENPRAKVRRMTVVAAHKAMPKKS